MTNYILICVGSAVVIGLLMAAAIIFIDKFIY